MTRLGLITAICAVCAFGAAAGEAVSFDSMDTNADGFVSETEYVSWATADGKASAADALVKFIEIDADASGMISQAELDAAMLASTETEADSHMTAKDDLR